MKLVRVFTIALTGLLGTALHSLAQDEFHTRLIGFREVPAISTVASGEFRAQIINDTTIAYELIYSGLEGTVTQAHIHFGQRFVAAGIALWLCQTDSNKDPTGLAPTCPQGLKDRRQ
jgi:hypothetical protein